MNHSPRTGRLAAATLAAAALLAGCGEREEGRTVGQQVDSALGRAGEAADDARTSVMGAGREAREAASAAGARMEDAQITTRVKAGLSADKDLSALRIDVDTREGVVTLSGSAPTAAARARAGEIARNVRDVRSVNNQLQVRAG
ncbi:BON domain-containing protein [Ramlibacter sp. MAHUQ-53]|uniref:BON domain-containing protein n=1 Tax=unclassified Ramlibacter TaxID=2617605 RepID=UPI0036267D75